MFVIDREKQWLAAVGLDGNSDRLVRWSTKFEMIVGEMIDFPNFCDSLIWCCPYRYHEENVRFI